MASDQAIISTFVRDAPPGELSNVISALETIAGAKRLAALSDPLREYHEEQFSTVNVPGSKTLALISTVNALGDGRYYDSASETSFEVDYSKQQASDAQKHALESPHADFVRSLQKAFSASSAEHFPTYTVGVFPKEQAVAVALVANKYSPSNFWNGRWRSQYLIDPSSGQVKGQVRVEVHYYEDGNVRMAFKKELELKSTSGDAESIVREIAKAENAVQTELNRSFNNLAEGSFKGLRRQLPVTRQRVEWDKIGGYRLGQDIGSGRK